MLGEMMKSPDSFCGDNYSSIIRETADDDLDLDF